MAEKKSQKSKASLIPSISATKNRVVKEDKQKMETKKLEILVTIVPRSKGDFYADIIQGFEVNMQMLIPANGTAPMEILGLLGMSSTEKTVIISAIKEENLKDALNTIEDKFNSIRGGKGVAFSIPMTSVIGVAIYGFLSNNEKVIKGAN